MRKLLTALLLAGFSVAHAQDSSPFGVPMGTTIAQILKLGAVYDAKSDIYVLKNPPIPNSAFDEYLIMATKNSGVCKILGIGKDIISSGDGYSLKVQVNTFKEILIKKYGQPTDSFDFLKSGSIWDRDNDFMMGLRSKDRYLDYYWQTEKGAKIGNNVASINLGGRAISSDKGYIVIGYEYKNIDDCSRERQQKDSTGL